MISWCIMAGWRDDVNVWGSYSSKTSFFLFATVFPWLLFIIFFVMMLFELHKKLTMINWPITVMIAIFVWIS